MTLLEPGSSIRDTYEVERFLGEGAFAEVYRVRHRFLGRQALKLFKRVGMTLPEIEEMLGEAILLSRIGHPNIVRVFDANVFDTNNGICGYFTMEHVSGGSLDKYWRSHGASFVPVAATVEVMKQVCRGLAVAHAETPPIIHRDIKPQNILVGYEAEGLRARVSDFGLAKRVNPLTLQATAAGTVHFKAPETFGRSKADSCAADVWALGTTLYLLLTDRLPFDVDPNMGWANKKAFDTSFTPPSIWNIDVDKSLDRLVQCCLEVNPSERVPSAKELLHELESWRPADAKARAQSKDSLSAEISKSVLGAATPQDSGQAQALCNSALQLAKDTGRLSEAADIMEEAFNLSPTLRDRFAKKVRLWRCGISM